MSELNASWRASPTSPTRARLRQRRQRERGIARGGRNPRVRLRAQSPLGPGTALGIINFEQGVKITGSRFYVLSGAGARLQRALIAWMLDLHIRQGYTEKYTPFMVKEETMFAPGSCPNSTTTCTTMSKRTCGWCRPPRCR